MSSDTQSVAFDAHPLSLSGPNTLPSMTSMTSMSSTDTWLGFTSGDFSSFGGSFPGGYGSFESKAFGAFPPLQSNQAVPVNVSAMERTSVTRAEVDSTGDSKGPSTPASAASASGGEERVSSDSSPPTSTASSNNNSISTSNSATSSNNSQTAPTTQVNSSANSNAGYRPWEQAAEPSPFAEEKNSSSNNNPPATKNPSANPSDPSPTAPSTESFHGPSPSEDSSSADQRPPSGFKASPPAASPFGSEGSGAAFRSSTAEADTTTTELRPVVPDFQVAAITSSTSNSGSSSGGISRPPSQMQPSPAQQLAPLEPLQPVQPLQPTFQSLQPLQPFQNLQPLQPATLTPLQQLQVPSTMGPGGLGGVGAHGPPSSMAAAAAAAAAAGPMGAGVPTMSQLSMPMHAGVAGVSMQVSQGWSQELASPQAVPVSMPPMSGSMSMQLGQLSGQHLLLQQHHPAHSQHSPGQNHSLSQSSSLRQLSTPPTPTQMVPPSSPPGLTTDGPGTPSLEQQRGGHQKKKRKRCGECPGCLKKDNCGECGPCRSVRSHQICKMRRCDTLVKTKKDKTPAQPRQKKSEGTKSKGNAKNARANSQEGETGNSGNQQGPPAKRQRATPDENKNTHQLTPDVKPQFSVLGAPAGSMYAPHDSSMPPPHMSAGYATPGAPPQPPTFAPPGQPGQPGLFNDPNQYASAPAPPAYSHPSMVTSGTPMSPASASPGSIGFQPGQGPQEGFSQQRHQLMNSRLKSLIQQRASQKEPEQNSQDGFRSPAQTPTTPTGAAPDGSPFYPAAGSGSQPEWGGSSGPGQSHLLNPAVKLEPSDQGQDPRTGPPPHSPATDMAAKASEASDRPPSSLSIGRQTPHAGQSPVPGYTLQGSFASPKSASHGFPQSPRHFEGQQEPSASSGSLNILNLPVGSYPGHLVPGYPPTSAAYDPQAPPLPGFSKPGAFYQAAPTEPFAGLQHPPADPGMYGGGGPLPSMSGMAGGFGLPALPPMQAGAQAGSAGLNLPGADPWWGRLEQMKTE
ncbi:DNA N6-methyl adenine demethylase-like isoform X2 [Varroa jacobsoni]|uniref:DNA N6-methyl adenine demethylase-like isoform X2 n=1 Tax=Varroa jacobsoni TaxID=62625 RepID=UPI000BF340D4|nr:DNA N6-methyl adenine demethylase-like isoform X2 [Varroa jacobsoni]